MIPVPESATASGLLAASVAMLTEADFAPALVGVNTTLNVQFAPAAKLGTSPSASSGLAGSGGP